MIDAAELRKLCLSCPGSAEKVPNSRRRALRWDPLHT